MGADTRSRLDTPIFTLGEYVSITEEDGDMLTFRVVGIDET